MPTPLIEALYILAYLAIFALVIGGAVYLFLTREKKGAQGAPSPLSRKTLELAKKLSGTYRLSDLEKLLTELAAIGAWGTIVELQLTRIGDIVQMSLGTHAVELYSHNNGVIADYLEKFRRSAWRR